jgi:hypothetical protein
MIENLSQYWDKADGKTKQKIHGCIFKMLKMYSAI